MGITKTLKSILFITLLLKAHNLYPFGTKYSGEFLKIGLGVREMGLGGAVVSSAQPVSAIYWNPALLNMNNRFSGQFMHSEEFGGVLNLDHISIAFPSYRDKSYGVGFFRSGVDDIPDTRKSLMDFGSDGLGPGDPGYRGPDPDGTEGNGKLDPGERLDFGRIGVFNASENALFLSLSRGINEKLSLGLTSKCIYKSLGTASGWGVGLDFGLLYTIKERWLLGISISDLTTTFLFWGDGEREIILPSIKIGSSYFLKLNFLPVNVQPMADVDFSFEGEEHYTDLELKFLTVRVKFGVETVIMDNISIRCGRGDLGNLHLGLGLMTPIGSIDYAFPMGKSYKILGDSHRIGLTVNFNEFKEWVKNKL